MRAIYKGVQRFKGRLLRPKLLASCAALLLISVAAVAELRTAFFQSLYFSRKAGELTFSVQPGANDGVRFPVGGPQDQRLGYAKLPAFVDSLKARDFSVEKQSVPSSELAEFIGEHGYAVYREKEVAGLQPPIEQRSARQTEIFPEIEPVAGNIDMSHFSRKWKATSTRLVGV